MARTDGTYRPGVSIHEAAVMLGVSPTTVRRWVASGRLRSRRLDRPQGEIVRVLLGPDELEVVPAACEQVPTEQVPTDAPPRTAEQVYAGDDRSQALAAWAASLLAPIAAELGAAHETIVAQAETIRDQAETIGRQGAELEAERAARQQLVTERDAGDASRRRDARRLALILAVVATLALAAVASPAWVR